ncbi:selenoneine synthase SenA [Variovorax sp. PAMC 28711]|uniref:selenoneine synthase SenA n=1 Tax=Variovorax sp. PAMC 28711 TaxID=1795631 RepID=UPI000AC1B705|nr:selenoneine synthase SenA [Variovorax sp. PAMC 28711]
MRRAGPAQIEAALTDGRAELFGLFDGFQRALGPDGLRIAQDAAVNLPLWELGHIGWFEEFWVSRHPGRTVGATCDPLLPRTPSVLPRADALYDSSNVAHASRWQLALPDADATRAYLTEVRQATLALLHAGGTTDDDLYFFRLVLFHEAMHREAWHFMARGLGIDLGPAMRRPAPPATDAPAAAAWRVPGALRRIGFDGPGFAFDNELGPHEVEVPAFSIDPAPVTWAAFLAFADAGGYDNEAVWTAAGREWLQRTRATRPMHLRRENGKWEQSAFGRWTPIDPSAAAVNLTAHEADAWCRWAGRRLPTEMEWETAADLAAHAQARGDSVFRWGEVWEWTSSPFAPYPGFQAHPYRDYSQPWFDGRRVLRGGSFATAPYLKHPCYRNFFTAERNDVFAGFRSCAAP